MISRTSEFATYPPGRSFVAAAIAAIERHGCVPLDMSRFPASHRSTMEECRRYVTESQIYLGILGRRYGSSFPARPDVSCVEFEYDTATEMALRDAMKVLIFLLDEEVEVPRRFYDDDEAATHRQRAFVERVTRERYYGKFSTSDELYLGVGAALRLLGETEGLPIRMDAGRVDTVRRPSRPDLVVDRPDLVARLTGLLTHGAPRGRLITVTGAGGLGKTTLAQVVCGREEVVERFPGGTLWVSLGPEMSEALLAQRLDDQHQALTERRIGSEDPHFVVRYLAERLTMAQPTLVVADGVDSGRQLEPFLRLRGACTLLVTTRRSRFLPGDQQPLPVGPMTVSEALAVLGDVQRPMADGLLRTTARWPLLLALVRGIIDRAREGRYLDEALPTLVAELERSGAIEVISTGGDLDEDDIRQLLSVTADASLSGPERERFGELAVFPAGVEIPVDVLALLWGRTAGLRRDAVRRLCLTFADRSLVQRYDVEAGVIQQHEPLHDEQRRWLDHHPGRWAATHAALVDAVAADLPAGAAGEWWRLPPEAEYLWRHLVRHLLEAGRRAEAERLTVDLRWVVAQLRVAGLGAVLADLALVATPTASLLGRVLGQSAHLLRPEDPARLVRDTLRARLTAVPGLRRLVDTDPPEAGEAHLRHEWDTPDPLSAALRIRFGGDQGRVHSCAVLPGPRPTLLTCGDDPVLRRWDLGSGVEEEVLTGHREPLRACAAGPDGYWAIAAAEDGSLRRWNLDEPSEPILFADPTTSTPARCCAVSADGTRVAAGNGDGEVRLWDAATGRLTRVLGGAAAVPRHQGAVYGCALAPDASWVVSVGVDGAVLLWDAETGAGQWLRPAGAARTRACAVDPVGRSLVAVDSHGDVTLWDLADRRVERRFRAPGTDLRTCAIDPRRRWVAAGSHDGALWFWDLADGTERVIRAAHDGAVLSCAVGPDGEWLVTTGKDGIRIWDTRPAGATPPRRGHRGVVRGCAVAPGGRWLATSGEDGTVQTWDLRTGATGVVLNAAPERGNDCVIAPDEQWLASAWDDGTVRIWHRDGRLPLVLRGHTGAVYACDIAPDGSWLASAGADSQIRIWSDPLSRPAAPRLAFAGGQGRIHRCAIGPEGAWLATAGAQGTVRIWDPTTGECLYTVDRRDGPVLACAVAREPGWLVTGSHHGLLRFWHPDGERPEPWRVPGALVGAAVNPEGTLLATAHSARQDHVLRVWSVPDQDLRAELRLGGELRDVAWMEGTDLICAVGANGAYLLRFTPPRA